MFRCYHINLGMENQIRRICQPVYEDLISKMALIHFWSKMSY